MIFRQFCTADDDVSYLVADPVTRFAALLDPHVNAGDAYRAVIRRLDLQVMYLLETHLHESHLSAAPAMRAETGARLIAHPCVGLTCVDRHVVDGDRLFMGEEYMSVIETPGHSPCSLSYLWHDRVFTGHTLLAGAAGPCQRDDADSGRLFDSVRDRLFGLPDATLVYPGRAFGNRRATTIGDERAGNIDVQPHITREQFIARRKAEATRGDGWRHDSLEANRRCRIFHPKHRRFDAEGEGR